jgi:transglutaminase-like putative cysteine protease
VFLGNCLFLKPVEKEPTVKSRLIYYKQVIDIYPAMLTKKFELTVLLPTDYEKHQIVHETIFSDDPERVFFDGKNKYAEFVIENFSRQEQILISSLIELFEYDLSTVKKQTNSIILNDPTKELKDYLVDEKYLEKDNVLIRNAVKEMKGKNEVDLVKQIYNFVLSHMEYKWFEPDDKGALYAFINKSSDCTEYSDLFVALCRAKNIPAREIEGFTLDGNNYKHNWAEAFIKDYGWIPFDPMNDDTGFMKANFDNLLNVYLYLSFIRNDKNLDGNHFAIWRIWGDKVDVELYDLFYNES